MIKVDLGNMDEDGWKLLRDQKRALLWLVDRQLPDGWTEFIEIESENVGNDLLDGLINFLDHIQDEAAKELGEVVVFGESFGRYDEETEEPDYGKCPNCGEGLHRIRGLSSEPEGLREDRYCPTCNTHYMCTKAHFVPLVR